MSESDPDCVKTHVLVVGRQGEVPGKPFLCSDRFHQSANAQNAHYPLHVVCQDVQRHFSTDVLECFHLEVRRSHPRVCTENLIRVDEVMESPKLAE